jgi:putative transposase
MARLARLTAPGYVHHVIHRGHNKQAVFRSSSDYEHVLLLLKEAAALHSIRIHAYVLMSNHFHLLLTPAAAGGLPLLMKTVARRYAQYFNRQHGSAGAVWDGRYRSSILEPSSQLLPCMAYIDLNPVRANLSDTPSNWAWSSHGHYVGLRDDPLVTPHPLVWALGNTPFERESRYKLCVLQGPSAAQQTALTSAVLSGWALGSPEFLTELTQHTDRRLTRKLPGRPKRVQTQATPESTVQQVS